MKPPGEVAMLEIHDHGNVRELRLARPPVNALDPELLTSLADAVAAAPDSGAAALVVSGSEGIFTAGLDIPTLLTLDRDGMTAALDVFFRAMEVLAESPVPVAAAITGHSPAGGLVLALFCDWRVMAEGPYKIGLNEVRVGIPMPRVIAEAAAWLVGSRNAAHLCTTGRLMGPEEALRIGLVDAVVPAAEVVAEARRWCDEVVALPPRAVALSRGVARSRLVELVSSNRADDCARLRDEWFRPDTQVPLRRLVAQLKEKGS
jgi:enoyl-CoA hydratase/carnithine racemase